MERINNLNVVYIDENPYNPGKWIIYVNHTMLNLGKVDGNGHVFGARLMGLDYPNYLRMCRDLYGAEITGKNHKYPIPQFTSEKEASRLAKELNRRIIKFVESLN